MQLPKISVVTPTLNQGRFLGETIHSFQAQDYPWKELIVVDGGSTDESLTILKSNEDKLIWLSIPGLGQSGAINHAWGLAQGDILSWLNSDDVLEPGVLQEVAAVFTSHPEVDIVYGDAVYVNKDGKELKNYTAQTFDYEKLIRKSINYIPQPSTFIRRKVFEKLGGLNEKLIYVMDLDYWLRAGLFFQFHYMSKVFSKIRLHGEAKSVKNAAPFAKEIVATYEALFSREDMPASILALRRTSLRSANYVAANICYWAQDFGSAWAYAKQGWLLQPLRPTPYLPLYALGKLGFGLFSRLRENPYTKVS